MARSERETKEEEGRRLILKGLAMRPDLINDLRERVKIAAALEREERRRKERLAKRLKAAGLAGALIAAGFFLARLKPGPNRQASVQAPARQAPPPRVAAPAKAAQAPAQVPVPVQAKAQVKRAVSAARRVRAGRSPTAFGGGTSSPEGSVGIEWVRIPGGTFTMGSSDYPNAQPHQVTVPDFEMAKTLVTNKQYKTCVAAGACTPAQDQGAAFDGDDQPVVGVDWNQARAFSKWAGGRLPSEAEWEYAARSGGRNWKYPWGNGSANCGNSVISGCGYNATAPVCSKPAGNTKQGLCDMAGNAWEWVEDLYHGSYNGAPTDGSAWIDPADSYRVSRGGSWGDDATLARSAFRDDGNPDFGGSAQSFRPSRSKKPGLGGAGPGPGGGGAAAILALPKLLNAAEILAGLRCFYPESERRAGRKGTVVAYLDIGVDGRVASLRIAKSAGPAFDAAAGRVAHLMRFSPAQGPLGAIPVTIAQSFVFKLAD